MFLFEVFFLFLLFALGACVGSFTNVLIDRIPRNESIFISRSHCEKCKKKISSFDLIPVLSYILLHGRCRGCKVKIPFRVFLLELFSGILFVVLFLFAFVNIVQYLVLCSILLALLSISIIDLEHGIIPDSLLIAFGILSCIFIFSTDFSSLLFHVLSAFVAFTFFLLIYLATRGRGIGFGDVKYSLVIGFVLTFQQLLVALYTAFLTGAVISIILVIVRKKKIRGETIPFGPFLSIGVVVALLFEKQIISIVTPLLGLR